MLFYSRMFRACIAGFMVTTFAIGCGPETDHEEGKAPQAFSGEEQDLGGLHVTVPGGWVVETPTSQMRKAQYRLPGADGAGDAQLAVFNFGAGQAGSVQANLDRWLGQMSQPDGSSSGAAAVVDERTVNGMRVTVMDVTGTYSESMGPMMQGGTPRADYHMTAAIVESSSGSFYFKLTGPEATVERWRDSFRAFIDSARQ